MHGTFCQSTAWVAVNTNPWYCLYKSFLLKHYLIVAILNVIGVEVFKVITLFGIQIKYKSCSQGNLLYRTASKLQL